MLWFVLIRSQPDARRRTWGEGWLAILGLIVWMIGQTGCDSSPNEAAEETKRVAQQTSGVARGPKEFLQAVFARYRGATTYRDRGRVHLSVVQNGQTIPRTAPMQIWLDRGELDLAVYDVRIAIEQAQLMAWIVDPMTNQWDSQVLRKAGAADSPTMKETLADPILAHRISAGLAGPPPQLEWIFEAQPMRALFESNYRFAFVGQQMIEGTFCRGVEATDPAAQDEMAQVLSTYRFWVDAKSSTVRRVDLPPVLISEGENQSPQIVELTIDLPDASFDPPAHRRPREGFPDQPRFVRRLVALPPTRPPLHWGQIPEAFALSDQLGKSLVSSAGHDRDVALVMHSTGDAASFESLRWFEAWRQQLANDDRVRCVVVVQDPSLVLPQHRFDFAVDPKGAAIKALKLDDAAGGGNFVLIDSKGRLIWSQQSLGPENLAGTLAITQDALNGVDVPARLRQQWKEQATQYQQRIEENRVR